MLVFEKIMKEYVKPVKYESLRELARNAPLEPGVYIWKDRDNRIIYVGKARVLKKRLQNYFSGNKDIKTRALLKHASSIETIISSNEYEALLLENTLIKQHSPKYNINLKDGKTYPLIRLSAGDFPKIWRTRQIVEDKSMYFGPYPNIQAVDRVLALIEKTFPLRKCRTFKKRKNPCLYYHITRCLAPCCGKVKKEDYKVQVERAKKILAGETETLTGDLREKMNEAATALKYEEAAALRNAIKAIEELAEPITMEDRDPENRDYIAFASEGIFTSFSVFSMRSGRMTGRELFCSRSAAGERESFETFITAYYSPDRDLPPKIFFAYAHDKDDLSNDTESGFAALKQYFKDTFGFVPQLLSPNEKRHEAALAMARQNALEELRRRQRERGAGPGLVELKKALNLKTKPLRIEGFDVSHLDGKYPVASLVSFWNGVPDKKNYRHFKLRTVIGIVDDYAAIREAVHRRYSRQLREEKELPDLILIDGGMGQVNAAKSVLYELGIKCDIAGLAKEEEKIYLPSVKEPLQLPERSEALKILQYVRDESHRFAKGLNQKLRSKDIVSSRVGQADVKLAAEKEPDYEE